MKIKATIKYHYTPFRMVKILKYIYVTTLNVVHCCGGVLVELWKIGCQFFNKQTNMQLPYDPATVVKYNNKSAIC